MCHILREFRLVLNVLLEVLDDGTALAVELRLELVQLLRVPLLETFALFTEMAKPMNS